MAEISKDLVEKYAPAVMFYEFHTAQLFMSSHDLLMERCKKLSEELGNMGVNFKEYVRKVTPNNQLKRQGKPMRRKGS